MALTGTSGYQAVIIPGQQRVMFSPEDTTYGTPGANTYLEPVTSITSAIQRQPFTASELTGVPASTFGMIETTHHTTITITTPFRANGLGAWALASMMGSSLGGAQDQTGVTPGTAPLQTVPALPGGTSPGTWGNPLPNAPTWNTVSGGAIATNTIPAGAQSHYITPNYASNISNTFTIWHDSGDGKFTSGQRGYLQMGAATVESIAFAFTPNTDLVCTITLQANFPKFRGVSGSTATANAPTGTVTPIIAPGNLGSTFSGNRMMGFQGISNNFNIYSSRNGTGNPLKYKNAILGGDLTITRTIEVLEAPYQQNPIYFLPGELVTTGTFDLLFDGLGDLNGSGGSAGTFEEGQTGMTNFVDASTSSSGSDPTTAFTNSIYQDYLAFKESGYQNGTGTAINDPIEVQYMDYEGLGFDIQFWPIKWNSFTLNASAQSLKANVGFTSYNDLLTAIPASGVGRVTAVSFVYLVNQIGGTGVTGTGNSTTLKMIQ